MIADQATGHLIRTIPGSGNFWLRYGTAPYWKVAGPFDLYTQAVHALTAALGADSGALSVDVEIVTGADREEARTGRKAQEER